MEEKFSVCFRSVLCLCVCLLTQIWRALGNHFACSNDTEKKKRFRFAEVGRIIYIYTGV